MANIKVTYQDMDNAGTELDRAHDDIQHRLQDLQKRIQHLVNDGYVTDRSSKAFDQSYQEFTQGAAKTIDGLHGMAQFLHQAAHTFKGADDDLAKQMHR